MYPVLYEIEIFDKYIRISSYPVFLLTAVLMILVGTMWFTAKNGFNYKKVIIVLVSSFFFGIVGARIVFILSSFSLRETEAIGLLSLKFKGFSIAGTFIFGFPAALVFGRLLKIDVFRISDFSTPFVGIGIALAKVGCFLSGCCFGTLTDSICGVTYPRLSQPHIYQSVKGIIPFIFADMHPVHPVQLYEAFVAGILGVFCLWLLNSRYKEKLRAGIVLGIFTVLYSVSRIVLGIFREPSYFERYPFLDQSIIFVPILIVALTFLLLRIKTKFQMLK